MAKQKGFTQHYRNTAFVKNQLGSKIPSGKRWQSSTNSAGFTLIEIIVVTGIIGLLAALVMASLNLSRVKSRDARRQEDLHEVETALEIYHNEKGAYPAVFDTWLYSTDAANPWIIDLGTNYIPEVPKDPRNKGNQIYRYYHNQNKIADWPMSAGGYILLVYPELEENGNFDTPWADDGKAFALFK